MLRSGAPILLAVHGGDGSERFTDFRGKPIDVTLHYHQLDSLAGQLGQADFSVETAESQVGPRLPPVAVVGPVPVWNSPRSPV